MSQGVQIFKVNVAIYWEEVVSTHFQKLFPTNYKHNLRCMI